MKPYRVVEIIEKEIRSLEIFMEEGANTKDSYDLASDKVEALRTVLGSYESDRCEF